MIKIVSGHIEVSREFHISHYKLWDLITDTTRWADWGPSIRKVECSDRYIKRGSRGRVKTIIGFWAPFIIKEFIDNRYWSWNVFGIRATGHRNAVQDNNKCYLIFELPFYAALYIVVFVIALKRIERNFYQ